MAIDCGRVGSSRVESERVLQVLALLELPPCNFVLFFNSGFFSVYDT